MAKSKRNTQPMDLFDASIAIEGLRSLFESIKVQNRNAEDALESNEREAFLTAIEAVATMGVRNCEEAVRKIQEARHG